MGGMFGKGIYFAQTPLKIWQYSQVSSHDTQFMLVCDVALGTETEMKVAGAPPRKIKLLNSIRCRSPCCPECDSVTGVTRDHGGSLRALEHVVYNPDQALPRYLLELRQHD